MKQLSDYIHLYLGADCFEIIGNKRLNRVLKVTPEIIRYCLTGTGTYVLSLRRLSSMTEEQMNECWFNMPGPVEVRCEYKDGGVKKFDATPEQVLYLLSKGFDLFGLIDAGLAIDAATA
jgi:hypothetical protein